MHFPQFPSGLQKVKAQPVQSIFCGHPPAWFGESLTGKSNLQWIDIKDSPILESSNTEKKKASKERKARKNGRKENNNQARWKQRQSFKHVICHVTYKHLK